MLNNQQRLICHKTKPNQIKNSQFKNNKNWNYPIIIQIHLIHLDQSHWLQHLFKRVGNLWNPSIVSINWWPDRMLRNTFGQTTWHLCAGRSEKSWSFGLRGHAPRFFFACRTKFIVWFLRHPKRGQPIGSSNFYTSCAWISIYTWSPHKNNFLSNPTWWDLWINIVLRPPHKNDFLSNPTWWDLWINIVFSPPHKNDLLSNPTLWDLWINIVFRPPHKNDFLSNPTWWDLWINITFWHSGGWLSVEHLVSGRPSPQGLPVS